MADELDEVEQRFRAEMSEYIGAIEDAVRDARNFAQANIEASGAVDDLRDHTAEAAGVIGDYRDHAAEAREADNMLRDSAVEAGEALGHVRDEAETASRALGSLRDKAFEASQGLDLMGLSGVSSFTSLAPLLGLIGGIVIAAAAVAPAASAMGLGFGAFGALALPTIKSVTGGLSQISQAQQAVQQATTAAARSKALQQLHQDWANMPAPIRATVSQLLKFKNEFESLGRSSGIQHDVLGDITKVLSIARSLLPQIVPLAQAGAKAIGGLLNSISAGVKSQGFIQFLQMMTRMVVPATQAITRLAGSVLSVLGHALESLAPMSVPFINFISALVKALGGPLTAGLHVIIQLFLGLAKAITPLLPGLSKIATTLIKDIGSGFQEFIPIIGQVVRLLGGAFLKVLQDLEPVIANALTPNSPFMFALKALPGILHAILPVFTGLASLLGQPFFAHAAVDIISAVVAFKGLVGVIGLVKNAFGLLTAVMSMNPIVLIIGAIALLVVAFVELWTHCKAFRDFWKDAWRDIRNWALDAWHFLDNDVFHPLMHGVEDVINFVKDHWKLILSILTGPIGAAVIFIISHWDTIRHETAHLVDDVVTFFRNLPGRILSALAHLASDLYNVGKNVVLGFIHGIESMFGAVVSAAGSLVSSLGHAVTSLLGIGSPSRVFRQHGIDTILGLVQGIQAATPQAVAAIQQTATALAGTKFGVSGATGAAAATAGGGTVNVQVPMSVAFGAGTGGLNSPQFLHYIQQVVQEAVLRYTGTNSGNGMYLPGRLS